MTTELDQQKRLVQYICNAAQLRLETLPYEKDQEKFKSNKIFYAVDTNILILYLDPQDKGPRNEEGGGGYGVVFFDDDKETTQILGAAISRFIFHHLANESNRPFILLPGHDAEIRGMYDYCTKAKQDFIETVGGEREKIKSILLKLLDEPNEDILVKRIEKYAPHLISYLFYDNNPSVKLNRLNYLLRKVCIARLDSAIRSSAFLDFNEEENFRLRNIFSMPRQLSEQFEESKYRLAWYDMLKKAIPSRKDNRIRPDCAALARLELINRHLMPTGYSMVLITGDEALFRAAWEYYPYGKDASSFATFYLRNPRAFLAAHEVLLPGEKSIIEDSYLINDWLDTLLASYTDERGVIEEQLREIGIPETKIVSSLEAQVQKVLEKDREAANKIRDDWNEHTEELKIAHSSVSELARGEIRRVFGSKFGGNVEGLLRRIDGILSKKNEETWKEFFDAVVRTGYELFSFAANEPVRKKNIPPVSFHSFEKTRNFVRTVISSKGIRNLNPEDLQKMIESLEEDDSTGYARSLAYGYLFAHHESFHVAALLAQHAIGIAQQEYRNNLENKKLNPSVGPPVISGREAYYFKAVILRISAKNQDDFKEVGRLLDEAEKAYKNDKKRDSGLSISDLRFKVEGAGIRLGKYLNQKFVRSASLEFSDESQLCEVFDEFIKLYERVDGEKDHWIQAIIERNLLTDVFTTAALLDENKILDEATKTACEEKLGKYRKNLEFQRSDDGFDIPVSRHVQMVYDYACARFGKATASQKKEIIEHLDKLKHEDFSRGNWSLYDKKRSNFFLKMTGKALQIYSPH